MKQLVFFASGSGTNFQSVIDAIQSGMMDAHICGLITNKRNIGAIGRAEKNDIPVEVLPPSAFKSQELYEKALFKTLRSWQPDLIVLAGYMLKIPVALIDAYPKQIINIHPSLLPKFGGQGFYGIKVHEAVLEADESRSGCSVHIVDEVYDRGPVLARQEVPVQDDDTPESLAERVLEQEHRLLPEAIRNYLSKL